MTATIPTLTCPPRFATRRNPDRLTLGPKVGEIAQRLGMTLMPAQQEVLDVALEVADDGGLAYPEVVLTAPRQNGKTAIVLSKLVHRARATAFFGGPQNILYTAQDRNHARKKWLDDHVARLRDCRSYREGRDYDVRLSNGSESIRWANGSRHGICAPTDTAGHGETIDEGVIDEAFAHEDDAVEQGMSPAMITRRNAQFFVLSTAGTRKSVYLYRKIVTGRQQCQRDDGGAIAYFEWAAGDDDDPADPMSWARANFALGFTITEAKLAKEWARLSAKGQEGVDQFRRAHLNVWPEVPLLEDVARKGELPSDLWQGCLVAGSKASTDKVFAYDVAMDQSWSAISVASPVGDRVHLEVIEHRPGTEWLVDRVVDLKESHRPRGVACNPDSPAAAFIAPLAKRGVEVLPVAGRDYMAACTGLYADVVNGNVVHIGQDELDASVDDAVRKALSDGWVWDRKSSAADITPLTSVTVALFALKKFPPRRRPLLAVT